MQILTRFVTLVREIMKIKNDSINNNGNMNCDCCIKENCTLKNNCKQEILVPS